MKPGAYIYLGHRGILSSHAAPSDYISESIDVTFVPDEAVRMVQVRIVNDVIDEPQEMFLARLMPVSSGVEIGQGEADVVINDDDSELLCCGYKWYHAWLSILHTQVVCSCECAITCNCYLIQW